MKKVIVVGAGPAGMAAAYAASKKAKVTLLERNEAPGKKLLLTGSGKCNYSNDDMSAAAFNFDKNHALNSVIEKITPKDLEAFFAKNGLLSYKKGGLYYPKSEKSETVRDLFINLLSEAGVECRYQSRVTGVSKENDTFFVTLEDKTVLEADSLIIATGGKAYPSTGSDGAGYRLARELGHTVTFTYPGLTRLLTNDKEVLEAAGLRAKGRVSVYVDNELKGVEDGEIQFNDTGLSGICIFKLCSLISKDIEDRKDCVVKIDFLPEMSREETKEYINEVCSNRKGVSKEKILSDMFGQKCAEMIVKKTKEGDFVDAVKEMTVKITAHDSFNTAQVTIGGVDKDEVNETLESKITKGLFFAGEVLDVNGTCGGYNLHFAFASGLIAGYAAGNEGEG